MTDRSHRISNSGDGANVGGGPCIGLCNDKPRIKAQVCCCLAPLIHESLAVCHWPLIRAGHQCGCIQCGRTFCLHGRVYLENLGAARTEGITNGFGNAHRFEIAMLAVFPNLVAELFYSQTEVRHGHGIEQRVVLPDPVIPQRSPFAIGSLGDIGNHGVKVRVGLLIAVRVVLEKPDHEIACRDHPLLASDFHAGFGEILLGPGQRLADGRAVGIEDTSVAADEGEDGPALGHRESEVGAGAMGPVIAPDTASIGQHALEHGLELRGFDDASQAKRLRAFAKPLTRSLGIGAGIVIVGGKVVGSAAGGTDIGYREHQVSLRQAAYASCVTVQNRRDRAPPAMADPARERRLRA